MYKISDKIIKFNTEAMKNWKGKLSTGEKINRVENPGRHLQERFAFAITLVIAMMSLSYKFKKFIRVNEFTKSQENLIHLICKGGINLFATRIGDTNPSHNDIHVGYQNGNGHRKCAILIIKSRKMTEEIELPNQERIRTLGVRKITKTWEYWKWKSSNK